VPPDEAVDEIIAEAGRLDVVVARMTGMPRADAQRAIAAGRVTVDGGRRGQSFRLGGGERVVVASAVDARLSAGGLPVDIRYRDDHLAVVAKPAGVVTHPTMRHRDDTLVNRLLGMGVPLAAAGGTQRPGIVHRLDVGTSGLVVVASTDDAFHRLRAMFRRHDVERGYVALVRGRVAHAAFAVDAPLGRRDAKIVVDRIGGRAAETVFDTRERLDAATLLRARPRTGRTHQIRVHLSAIGHPILGDRAYGGGGRDASELGLERPFLHAERLAFEHPITREGIDLDEDLPDDLTRALGRARRTS
jgi:23S rRNA pseudouridine1911/1915/1917 synthase